MSELCNIHMASNLSEWTSTATDSGDLAWSASAGLGGTTGGMAVLIDDTNVIYGRYTLGVADTSGVLRFRIYIDPNSLTMANSDNFNWVYISSTTQYVCYLALLYTTASGYQLRAAIRDDAGAYSTSAWIAISDAPHYVEVQLNRATGSTASDGSLSWWIDGAAQTALTGKDNFDYFANFSFISAGAVGQMDAGTSGTFYLDELVVRNDSTPIGAVSTSTEESVSLARTASTTAAGQVEFQDAATLARKGTAAGGEGLSAENAVSLARKATAEGAAQVELQDAATLARKATAAAASLITAQDGVSLPRKGTAVAAGQVELQDALSLAMKATATAEGEKAGLIIEESVTLARIIRCAEPWINQIDESASLARALGITVSATVEVSVGIALALTRTEGDAGQAALQDGTTAARVATAAAASLVRAEDGATVAKKATASAASLITAESGTTIARTATASPASLISGGDAVSLARAMGIQAAAGASTVDESASLARVMGITVSATVEVSVGIALALTRTEGDAGQASLLDGATAARVMAASAVSLVSVENGATLAKVATAAAGSLITAEDGAALARMATIGAGSLIEGSESTSLERVLGIRAEAGAATVDELVTLARRMALEAMATAAMAGEVALGRSLGSTVEGQLTAGEALSLGQRSGIGLGSNASVSVETVLQTALTIAAVGGYRPAHSKGYAALSDGPANRAAIADRLAGRATAAASLTSGAAVTNRAANGADIGDQSATGLTVEDQ